MHQIRPLDGFWGSREERFAALDSMRYYGGRPLALLTRLDDLHRVAGFPLTAEMLRHPPAAADPPPVGYCPANPIHTKIRCTRGSFS